MVTECLRTSCNIRRGLIHEQRMKWNSIDCIASSFSFNQSLMIGYFCDCLWLVTCDWLELDIREFKNLRQLLQGKSHFKIEFCRRFRFKLVGANCFYVNTENERFIIAGLRCRQKTWNLKASGRLTDYCKEIFLSECYTCSKILINQWYFIDLCRCRYVNIREL